MNSVIENYYPLFSYYQALRNQLLEIVSDDDLAFQLPGDNHTLGFLCKQIGEVQHSYIQSFKTFKQEWSYKNSDPELESSVARLVGWYTDLDRELRTVVEALSEDELHNRQIDRGDGFNTSPRAQLEIYKEALLIFYAKASIYLKALSIPLPEQWADWIT